MTGVRPNNSFKPNPHRGTAWVLFRYASTQSPPRYGFGLTQALALILTLIFPRRIESHELAPHNSYCACCFYRYYTQRPIRSRK